MLRVSSLTAALLLCLATASPALPPQARSVAATDAATLAASSNQVSAMLRDGRLDLVQITDDTMIPGRRHERLGQRHEGLPVFGAQIVRQTDGGVVQTIFGQMYDSISVSTTPVVDAVAASEAARVSLGDDAVVSAEPVLGVLPTDGGFALAWRTLVRSPRDIRVVYVNAITKTIESSITRIQTQVASGVIGHGKGVLGDDKKISVDRGSGGYEARDRLRPASIETYDFGGDFNRVYDLLTAEILRPADIARDDDNVWTDPATVDAHVYVGWTYDFYFKQFGRKSLDDGNVPLTAVVHPLSRAEAAGRPDLSVFSDNASYVGIGHGYMIFGDGLDLFNYTSGALDVAAHELTHGVTDYSSGLVYRNESGALNESFSDIMAVAAEFFYAQQGVTPRPADWLVGEDVTKLPPGYLRSFSDPLSGFDAQPDHYSIRYTGPFDNGGVHINSGISNHAFYLAVHGGTNRVSRITVQGVGEANIDRIAKIFYRAFVFFLTPGSRFHDARVATLQAASDLYGPSSNERQQVERAWDAVGVQ